MHKLDKFTLGVIFLLGLNLIFSTGQLLFKVIPDDWMMPIIALDLFLIAALLIGNIYFGARQRDKQKREK